MALSHFIFNLGTDVTAFLLLTPLLAFITVMLGIDDTMYALVCFHSLFNLLGIVLFLPFTKPFARWLEQHFTATSTLGCSHVTLVPPTVPEAALRAIAQDTYELIIKALLINLRILKLPSETLLGGEEVKRINRRLFRESLTFDEQYADIKAHEAQLQNYSHKLPADSLSETEEKILTELLDAARDTSYSAKSLKDVKDNLIHLRHQAGTQQLLKRIDADILSIYPAITELLEKPANDWADDAVSTIKSAIAHSHDFLHQQMIDYSHSQHSEIILPTLFNINREIYVSNQNLLDATLTLSTCRQALAVNNNQHTGLNGQ
ncbi:MAG: hypothetical protein AB9Q18_02630 [Candidatus Reddybacter sp.]